MATYENGVLVRYTGTNKGSITIRGVDRSRSYRVSAGWEGTVHPDDAAKLLALANFEAVDTAPEDTAPEDTAPFELEGYEDMNADEVIAAISGYDATQLGQFRDYEVSNKNRVGVLREVDSMLEAVGTE